MIDNARHFAFAVGVWLNGEARASLSYAYGLSDWETVCDHCPIPQADAAKVF